MSILDILYTILIMPLQLIFETLYMMTNTMMDNPGLSIVALSLMMNFLVLPLYMRADAMQEHERDMEAKLRDGVAHIKKTFKGDEKVMMLQTYYRQNNYKPTDVFKGSVSLFLEIPFFISAYMFLSHLEIIKGVSFWFIKDLGAPDALLCMGDITINVLPFVMTGINLISCVLFTRGMPAKTKVQLYGMALFFLVFLYASPAGLVFYWTLNNVFALVKTIFYKLKNPKKVLIALFAVVGVVLVVYGLLFYDNAGRAKRTALVVALGVACVLPLVVSLIRGKIKAKPRPWTRQPSLKTFVAGTLFLTVFLGCVIPSTVIASSPQEFVDIAFFVHPNWYVVSSLCLAAGMFLVWFGVFYWLCNKQAKTIFELGVWILCGIALLNYMVFGGDFGVLSSSLQYEQSVVYTKSQMLINLGCVVVLGVVFAMVFFKLPKVAPTVMALATVAFVGMTGVNLVGINSSVAEALPQVESYKESRPSFTLSKTGQNVVYLMMDRAMGEYIPYIMEEKPELKESFSGFTYYENVMSFGGVTNFGSPAVYGGYEYTPVEMDKRDQELLVDKHNESLKVMPVLFDQAGYDVTVCDPTYANYQWVPDLSIYKEYPNIKAYNTMGAFSDEESAQQKVSNAKRNFFCFGVTRCLPLLAQPAFYNQGNYNNSAPGTNLWGVQQISEDHLTADGLSDVFMESYSVLENLNSMTVVSDDAANTFLMLSNDATHEPTLLQEGEYVPQSLVDNTQYEVEHAGRNVVGGVTLNMNDTNQVTHYQINMGSLLQIAQWLDYLKENGVYDNTRIVIVSDHGRPTYQLDSLVMDDGSDTLLDVEYYYPLLMVKDFNATGFETSTEFMTNADGPVLATQNLPFAAVNPFTGRELTSAEKTAHDQYVYGSRSFLVSENNGTTYLDDYILFSVHDDMRDVSNWRIERDPRGK